MAKSNNFLHIARPFGPATVGAPSSTSPMKVLIHPQAVLSIIDHATRRNVEQERVIGTLLGTRLEDGSEVEIRNCFAVGHSEAQDQVEVDMEYQKSMLALHLRANPKEVLVGWYATSSELNTFSALIQNFYGSQGDGTYPHPAVHLTVSTDPGKELELQTYISAPIGVTPERSADSAAFIPVPYELRYSEADKSGLEFISSAKDDENRVSGVVSDIEALERGIEDVLQMLDRVSRYVEAVIEEEAPPSRALGQYLLNTLALAPKIDTATIEKDFHNHVQDVLSIAYLANTIRTQIELSNRLATATLTLGGFSEEGGQGNRDGHRDGDNRRGGRGGGRGGRGGKGGRDNADRGEKAE